jgi:acetolactate synthase small subunit
MHHAVLDIDLADRTGALMRVLTVLSRRRCEISSIDFAAVDRRRQARLTIGVVAPAGRAHCIEAWLENLVDVRAVRAHHGGAATHVTTP